MKKSLFLTLFTLGLSTALLNAHNPVIAAGSIAASSTNQTSFSARISSDLVQSAGFTVITQKLPSTNHYQSPVYYFTTTETVAGSAGAAWGEARNLVAVLVTPIPNEKWVFNQGDMLVTEVEGRFQASLSSPGYFISITGPDKNKVMTLAHNLKVLY